MGREIQGVVGEKSRNIGVVRWERKGGEEEGDKREGEGVSGKGKEVLGDEREENWNAEERKLHVEGWWWDREEEGDIKREEKAEVVHIQWVVGGRGEHVSVGQGLSEEEVVTKGDERRREGWGQGTRRAAALGQTGVRTAAVCAPAAVVALDHETPLKLAAEEARDELLSGGAESM